jgi:hypothetical protein
MTANDLWGIENAKLFLREPLAGADGREAQAR